jgi:glycerophosphoryl diester phosphodiesterase
MLSHLPKPAVFAHRGVSAHAPENTLSAFKQALDLKADGIELDVSLTADGHVVVIHDGVIDRTTNGTGNVKDLKLDELRQYDAGSWFDPKFKGQTIPTLDEVLNLVGEKLFTNIELKNLNAPFDQLSEKTCKIVKDHGLTNRVIFSSFNPWALVEAHRHLPEVPRGLLLPPGRLGKVFKIAFGWWVDYQSLHPHYPAVTPQMIRQANNKGFKVLAYTVNQPEDMARLMKLGIDGIITDDPGLAMKVRAEVS